jgi:exopolyphosphatase / guanosine-5'-triphosphate,3'-diphosphate pyrophosphatase
VRAVVGASIDVGSNSVHLLVTAIEEHRLRTLADESVFLGLGKAIVERQHLGTEARGELAAALAAYVTTARDHGATKVTIIGTEPIRRAGDGVAAVVDVERGTGVPLHVITHEEEAWLTAIGVTGGRPVEHETLVIDVGGGSSEFCLIGPNGPPRATGLRLGSDRLTRHHVHHDPPTTDELVAMLNEAREIVDRLPAVSPQEIVAVGGTVSNLMKVVRYGVSEGELTRDETARALQLLTAEPAEMAAKRHNIKPIRARILPAGAVIVDAILRRFGADALRVSDAGMREGAILAAHHAGRAWRDRLPDLAHGWRE